MAKKRAVIVTVPTKRAMQKKKKQPKGSARASVQELTRLGAALRGLGSIGGSALGGLVGQSNAGGSIGKNLGASFSKWLGSGDYTVSANSLADKIGADGSIPSMHKNDQSIIIRHKEFLGEISGSTTFAVRSTININPGLAESFPWLSSIAGKFLEYRIKGMVFHYVPSSGTALSSTSAALGTVMIQTSYRSNDTPPTSKTEILNEYWSSEGRPCDSFCHPIECDPKENPYNLHYVRTGALPASYDQLLYDIGTTYVATSGMQTADQVLGDLWVTYEIELKKPVVVSNVSDAAQAFAAQVTDVSGSITGTTLFDGNVNYGNGNLTGRITLAGNVITLAKTVAGYFYFMVDCEAATAFTAATVSSTPLVVGAVATKFSATNNVVRTILGGGTPTLTRFFYCVTVFKPTTDAVATITIPPVTLTGAASRTDLLIFQRFSPLWP